MAWAWNKTVDYVLVEAWSGLRVYMHFIWVPSSLISGGSREGRGLVLASTLRAPPSPTVMQADPEEGVCFAFAVLLTQWSRKCFQGGRGLFECLDFGIPVHGGMPSLFSSCLRKVTGLRGLTAG